MAPQSRQQSSVPAKRNRKQPSTKFVETFTPTNKPTGRISKTRHPRWGKLERITKLLYRIYSLDKTRELIKMHFGFDESKAIYTKQLKEWGVRKEITKAEYDEMYKHYERDQEEDSPTIGQNSEFYIQGMVVPLGKLKAYRSGPQFQKPTEDGRNGGGSTASRFIVQKRIPHHDLPWFKFSRGFELTIPRLPLQLLNIFISTEFKADQDMRAAATLDMYQRLCAITLEGDPGEFLDFILNFSNTPIQSDQFVFAVKLILFLASNNLLPEFIADRFVNVFVTREKLNSLELICSNKTPTCRAFSAEVFRSALRHKNSYIVRSLLQAKLVSTKLKYYEFGSVLWYAAFSGSLENVNALLNAGADPNLSAPESPLQVAARKGHLRIVKRLLEFGANVDSIGSSRDPVCSTPLQLAARSKHVGVVGVLLDKGADVNAPYGPHQDSELDWYLGLSDSDIEIGGGSALRAAVYFHHADTIVPHNRKAAEEIVRRLLEKGANVRDEPEALSEEDAPKTALQAAALHGLADVVKMLLEAGANVNAPAHREDGYPDGMTALQAAVASGNKDTVTALLEHHETANVNALAYSLTALQAACQYHHKYLVQLLLEKKADVNTPVPGHSRRGNALTIILEPLLAQDGDYDNGRTHRALKQVEYEVAAMLIQAGADIHMLEVVTAVGRDTSGRLLEIVSGGNSDYQRAYLKRHSNAVLSGAASAGFGKPVGPNGRRNCEFVRYLLENGAGLDTTRHDAAQPLLCAAASRDIDSVDLLINAGANIKTDNPRLKADSTTVIPTGLTMNTTVLEAACLTDDAEFISQLIERGAVVNPKHGTPPLHIAIGRGNISLVRILLEAGADPNAPPREQRFNALQRACRSGNLEIVQLLLSSDTIDVNKLPDPSGGRTAVSLTSALQEAVRRNYYSIVEALLEKGALLENPRKTFKQPYSTDDTLVTLAPLSGIQEAVRAGNLEILGSLLNKDPTLVKNDGIILRLALIRHKPKLESEIRYNMAKLLVEHNASIDGDSEGVPLVDACRFGELNIVQLLLDSGANVNILSKYGKGQTALQAACRQGYLGIVKLLLSRGADPNAFGHRTALEWAADYGRLDIVALLLQSGASLRVKRTYYLTIDGTRQKMAGTQFGYAWRVAKKRGFREVSDLIRRKMHEDEMMKVDEHFKIEIDLGSFDFSEPNYSAFIHEIEDDEPEMQAEPEISRKTPQQLGEGQNREQTAHISLASPEPTQEIAPLSSPSQAFDTEPHPREELPSISLDQNTNSDTGDGFFSNLLSSDGMNPADNLPVVDQAFNSVDTENNNFLPGDEFQLDAFALLSEGTQNIYQPPQFWEQFTPQHADPSSNDPMQLGQTDANQEASSQIPPPPSVPFQLDEWFDGDMLGLPGLDEMDGLFDDAFMDPRMGMD